MIKHAVDKNGKYKQFVGGVKKNGDIVEPVLPEGYTEVFVQPEHGFMVWDDQAGAFVWDEAGLAKIKERNDAIKRTMYEKEADPLFFKWKRGEATEQEYLDKIQEIKQRSV